MVLTAYPLHAGKYGAARKLMELVQHTESDAWLALSLAAHLNLLPLSRQLSCITGYLWSRTLQARLSCICLSFIPLPSGKITARSCLRITLRRHACKHKLYLAKQRVSMLL